MSSCNETKSILILTSEYYGSANMIGSHQLAKQLAVMGHKVYLVSFPISPLYCFMARKTDYFKRKLLNKAFIEVESNLFCHVPKVLIPPLPSIVKFSASYLKSWYAQCFRSNTLLKSQSYDFILTESLFYNALYKKLSYEKLIVRLPDNLSGFWGNIPALHAAQNDLLDRADLVVSPSKQVLNELPPDIKDKMYLPNGVRLSQYSKSTSPPKYFERLTFKHHAIYVGAIQKWFDHELLEETARLKPEWCFTIIGKKPSINLDTYPDNVCFIGEVPNSKIAAFLQHADVGIIPFETIKNKDLIRYVNPIKLYEYLAAGLSVISSRWTELELLNAPITLIESSQEFSNALTQLEKSGSVHFINSEFSAQFDWSKIADSLLKKVSSINEKTR